MSITAKIILNRKLACRRNVAMNLYQNVLECIYDQPFNTQKPHTSARMSWPDKLQTHKINTIGVTGFEVITSQKNTARKGICVASYPQVTRRSREVTHKSTIHAT